MQYNLEQIDTQKREKNGYGACIPVVWKQLLTTIEVQIENHHHHISFLLYYQFHFYLVSYSHGAPVRLGEDTSILVKVSGELFVELQYTCDFLAETLV